MDLAIVSKYLFLFPRMPLLSFFEHLKISSGDSSPVLEGHCRGKRRAVRKVAAFRTPVKASGGRDKYWEVEFQENLER